MENVSKQDRREIIGLFYQTHVALGKKGVVRHFEEMGVSRRTIYSILNRVDNQITLKRKPGSGGHNVKMDKNKSQRLIRLVNNKTGVSQRKLADTFGVTQATVSNTLKKHSIRYYKRKTAPTANEKQQAVQKVRLRRLARKVLNPKSKVVIVQDDESYFTLTGAGMPGNSGFYSSDKSSTPENIKYKQAGKFPERVMVWAAISSKGVSKLHITAKRETMNSEIYLNKCLKAILLPYIDKHFTSRKKIMFWPDNATCHYSKSVLSFLQAKNVLFVKQVNNPPNVPQLHPVENFWGIIKQQVYSYN